MAYDPNQIDISLSLLSGEDSRAAKDLAKQLQASAEYLKAINSSFESYGAKLERIANTLARATSGQTGGASVANMVQAGGGAPNEQTVRRLLNQYPGAQTLGGGSGGASVASAANPSGDPVPDQQQSWINRALQRVPVLNKGYSEAAGGWQIPGQIAGFGKDWMTRYLEYNVNPARALQAANLGPNIAPAGGQLGYSFGASGAGQQVGVGPFGFTVPGTQYLGGSEGAAEARRMAALTAELRMGRKVGGAINKGQAEAIQTALSSSGFSGDLASSLAMDVMGPTFAKYKMDPQIMTRFFGQIRTGTESVGRVKKEMDDLAEGSKSASMNLNQFAEQVLAAGEVNEQLGGTALSGRAKASAFSVSTGLAPDRWSQLAQNPMIQGILTGQTGLPPQLQGLLPGTSVSQGITTAMNMFGQGYSGAAKEWASRSIPITDPVTGKVIGHKKLSAEDIRLSLAGQAIGLNLNEMKQMKGKAARMSLASSDIVGGDRHGVSDAELRSLMQEGGLSHAERNKIIAMDPSKRHTALQQALRHHTQGERDKNVPKVELTLSKKAEGLFDFVTAKSKGGKTAKKILVNAGEAVGAAAFGGPIGPSVLAGEKLLKDIF